MIYLFTHFAKHYRDGGIGFRHLTDLYVYKNANPDLDEEYILKELTLLQLDAFYKNICDALAVAFENKSGNEITDMILSFVADSGVYGTAHKHIIAAGAREKASGSTVKQVRRKHWLQLIVPSYSTMCEKYPVLKKLPVLLPVMWVVRWLAALFGKRQKIQSQSKKMQVMTEESIESYEQALHAVGLAFHFEE